MVSLQPPFITYYPNTFPNGPSKLTRTQRLSTELQGLEQSNKITKKSSQRIGMLSKEEFVVAREDDRGVTEGREDVHEVFQQRRSGAKRKLSRCGRNQMGNEPILALPKGADDFVVYYDARSKDLKACLEKGRREALVNETWKSNSYGMNVSNTLSIEGLNMRQGDGWIMLFIEFDFEASTI
ncbi:hypothetical protein Tco_0085000 [Tanacetum coccineum]